MKIGRQFLNKVVSVRWRDPGYDRKPMLRALKGRDALAVWEEYGVIDDVTDGVVRIVHSAGKEPGAAAVDEICYTVIDEALVESVTVYEPVKPPAEGPA